MAPTHTSDKAHPWAWRTEDFMNWTTLVTEIWLQHEYLEVNNGGVFSLFLILIISCFIMIWPNQQYCAANYFYARWQCGNWIACLCHKISCLLFRKQKTVLNGLLNLLTEKRKQAVLFINNWFPVVKLNSPCFAPSVTLGHNCGERTP